MFTYLLFLPSAVCFSPQDRTDWDEVPGGPDSGPQRPHTGNQLPPFTRRGLHTSGSWPHAATRPVAASTFRAVRPHHDLQQQQLLQAPQPSGELGQRAGVEAPGPALPDGGRDRDPGQLSEPSDEPANLQGLQPSFLRFLPAERGFR